jgi:hypothetical protein
VITSPSRKAPGSALRWSATPLAIGSPKAGGLSCDVGDVRSADRVDEIAHVCIVSAGRGEGDGWVNWSGLATLVANLATGFAGSLNHLVPPRVRDPRAHTVR